MERPPITNTHEHIQSRAQSPVLFGSMDACGVEKVVLLGSSWFTITLDPAVGFSRYDWNNSEILAIARQHPDRVEAWPTIWTRDLAMLDKLKAMLDQGATGLKLYLGHGLVNSRTGRYLFHTCSLDNPRVLPVYDFCQKNYVPICYHVNCGIPAFARQLVNVLRMFPDLLVNIPHFMLSSSKPSRLLEFLLTFPNVVTDISFGHDNFLLAGMLRVSKSIRLFKSIFENFPDRFLFGTDLVLTNARRKTNEWLQARIGLYRAFLENDTFESEVFPGHQLQGLGLSSELVVKVLSKNFLSFKSRRPSGTVILREINWTKM